MTARKAAADQSFADFWATVSGGRTEHIRGVDVAVPTDVPLAMELRLKELQESESEDDLKELVALLFGAGVLDQWVDNGMGLAEFQTVLAWGLAHASGQKLTFAEAYAMVQEQEQGKAPANRAARRNASKSRSASTGGRSVRTSAASTASARKSSRA